ncbi:MAG: glycosyltransferase family 4 protein [Candidatus Hydrogenedentes bacterium]|nr:glycosyltransferase family 4 protein [Candidatus Hydrogenedentota bacterium]
MKRVLVLYARDWLNPESGAIEHYLHEVFARIVGHGHYVAWISHTYPVWPFSRKQAPQLEIVDGIQIARLGIRYFHRAMVGMLLAKLSRSGKFQRNFDAIIDCVTAYPMSAAEQAPVPVVPLVFGLKRNTLAIEHPPRPIIAVTDYARRQLTQAGVPETRIISAPFAVDHEIYAPSFVPDAPSALVAVDHNPKCLAGALRRLIGQAQLPAIHLLGGKMRRFNRERVIHFPFGDEEHRANLYRNALMGYCGEGAESEALAFAASGVPVICPATPAGREYILDDQTGLLFEPGNQAALADLLVRLTKDELLRRRLSVRARERAKEMSWDKTASLVLAAIENL